MTLRVRVSIGANQEGSYRYEVGLFLRFQELRFGHN